MDGALFIAFEGGEGAGKTTQAQLLYDALQELGRPVDLVREPGGTDLGEYLRDYLKSERPLTPEAELLLFAAARVELAVNRIKPALAAGGIVIADRFGASTVAYQGYGRGLDLGVISALNGFATVGCRPDLILLLDVEPTVGLRRTVGHQMAFGENLFRDLIPLHRNAEGRRFEDLALEFHERVRQGFREQAANAPERWAVIDAAPSIEQVWAQVWGQVEGRLEGRRG